MQLSSTNIGTVEVGNAIGLYVHDYGLLCFNGEVEEVGGVWQAKVPFVSADRIKKWSKWKPVIHSVLPLTETMLKARNYGLTIPTNSYYDLRNYALTTLDITDNSTQIKWTYNPPTGKIPFNRSVSFIKIDNMKPTRQDDDDRSGGGGVPTPPVRP